MFRNFYITILRNLWRNKIYSFVNIISLAVGIAAIVWGYQDYRFSFSYNNAQPDRGNIFRVLMKVTGSDSKKGISPAALAKFAKNDLQMVQNAVRWDSRQLNLKAGQADAFQTRAHFTDPEFFKLFNFPLVSGNIQLEDRTTVVLTQKSAKKFFGDSDPIGKTLVFYSDETFRKPLKVTGILKDPPVNSSFQFDLITNTENLIKPDGQLLKDNDWSWFSNAIFFKLSNPASASEVAARLSKYLPLQHSARPDSKAVSFILQPLAEMGNDINVDSNALYTRPSDAAAFGPLILALLILLSACLNFANTSIAQSNRRLKEMGVRKVMGSSYGLIIFQQLMECACIVFLAVCLSVMINNFWLPAFNSMFEGIAVSAHYFRDYRLLLFVALLFTVTTLLAGAYPAFYISRFNAANIFRGSVTFGGSNLFSRILLGLQVAISLVTVIAAVAFSRNASFQRMYDYGYEKDNVIGVDLQNQTTYAAFRNELNAVPGIDQTAGTINNIGFSYSRIPLEAKGEKVESVFIETGENYINLMRLKLVSGRNFNAQGEAEKTSMLINEHLAFQLGWKPGEAIGQHITKGDSTIYTVVGVLKDFTQNTLFEPITAVAMTRATPDRYARVIIRAKPGMLSDVFAKTKSIWAKLYPLKPFAGYYQDEIAGEASRVNKSVSIIFNWFALISILMAATSMYALVSLNVMKRSKEIAIRKVVGAGDLQIFRLVMKGYAWIFLISATIGCYGGYVLSKLLMDLIFRINSGVSLSSLTLSFISILFVCGITIGVKVWSVLKTKASDTLKAS